MLSLKNLFNFGGNLDLINCGGRRCGWNCTVRFFGLLTFILLLLDFLEKNIFSNLTFLCGEKESS